MCGIAGLFGRADAATVERMLAVEAHRGPDDSGTYVAARPPVTLGHVRLSILDLTAAGHQPMGHAGGRLHIVFNGEIYNFREIRDELAARGHRFKSHSDTEVVLAAYQVWGTSCVERLRGMFAFALVDADPPHGAPRYVLARDRLGIKPLLYTDVGGTLAFASEVRALLATGMVDRVVDPDGLLDFLAVGAVYQPRTMIAGIHALPPGHLLLGYGDRWELKRFWDLHEATHALRHQLRDIGDREAIDRVRAAILDATRLHMIADVPVGAFLSGGIDSTAIVGWMTKVSGRPIRTFSVGFEEAFGAYDERGFARLAANALGSEHREVVVGASDVAAVLDRFPLALDQPSVDGLNTYLVSAAARAEVKVALSGLGGDELFAGYPHFEELETAARVSPDGHPGSVAPLRALQSRLGRLGILIRPHLLNALDPAARYAQLRRVLDDTALPQAIRPRFRRDADSKLQSRHSSWLRADADPIQQTSYDEVRGYLLSTLLRDADVASMAHALEVRPVLLDHPLVELAYALPPRMKLRGAETKYVLVQASEEFLPEPLRLRKKMGFTLPSDGWLAGPLRERFEDYLGTAAASELLEPDHRDELLLGLGKGQPRRETWALGMLFAWLSGNRVRLT